MEAMIGTRRCDRLVEALKAEFGAIGSARILEAEAADFLWESRVRERYLGEAPASFSEDDDGSEVLFRTAFLSVLDGRWHAGTCLVDGEGDVADLIWRRDFTCSEEAEVAFERAR